MYKTMHGFYEKEDFYPKHKHPSKVKKSKVNTCVQIKEEMTT